MKKNPPIINEYTGKEPPQFRSNPYKYDVLYTPEGQWKYPGQVTKIPNRNITMKGVNYPVLGVDDLGNEQMMQPGMDYTFPGQTVTEYPQMKKGGTHFKKGEKYHDYTQRARINEILMQKGGRAPIYTEDPNDPKLKAYRDSLNIYNKFKPKSYERVLTGKDLIYDYPYDQLTQRLKNSFTGMEYQGWNNLKQEAIKTYGMAPVAENVDGMWKDHHKPVFKKPVQPYIYGKPPVQELQQFTSQDYIQPIRTTLPIQQMQEQELRIPISSQDTIANKRIAWRKDPTTKKMVPVITNTNQPVSQGKRIYNKDVPSSTGAIPGDFVPDYGTATSFEIGGWLDEMKLGGTPSSLQQFKAKRGKTSKNIQSSINKLFLRNHTLYGFSGKNIYDHTAKFQEGGNWLDNLT
jgi:hypothetical protein